MNTLAVCPKCLKTNRVPLGRTTLGVPVCGSCNCTLPVHEGVQDLEPTTLAKLVTVADRPLIVDFWAPWCGPCLAFAPTFKGAASEHAADLIFAKIDTQAHPEAAQKFGIRGIPTLIVFKNGREVDRQSGAMPAQMFSQYLMQWKGNNKNEQTQSKA